MIHSGSLLDEEDQENGVGAFIQWAFQKGNRTGAQAQSHH